MTSTHDFSSSLTWELSQGGTTQNPRKFSRNHVVQVSGKPPLEVSAAKPFRGDSAKYNPEDLLLSAVSSCHMMSYLYVCSQHHVEVLSYTDEANGILEVVGEGGKFTKVELNPVVVLRNEKDINLAKELHKKASELCFIANSCDFPIVYNPTVSV